MATPDKMTVFISYSWKDKDVADQIRNSIPSQFDVWIDSERIAPGDSISRAIQDGLSGSDYYVLLISEESNRSTWVQREIATAFDLANSKKLSVVPILLSHTPVPFEFKGLLYFDFTQSISDGLEQLRNFFLDQSSVIAEIEPRHIMLKSQDNAIQRRLQCNELLRRLSLGELRYHISERLSLEEIEVIWFDLFNRRMVDEVQVRSVALSCVELIDRSRRMDTLVFLMDTLCRNFPSVSRGLESIGR